VVFVHLIPPLVPDGALRGGVVLVIDVLRASTMIVHALRAGCSSIIPCLEIEEAWRVAGSFPKGSVLLAGERDGISIEGFDLGNSPSECTPELCDGKTVVFTTTNGTRALQACLEARAVVIGALVNFEATCARLEGESGSLHLLCAGTDGQISYEDTLVAGAFVKHFLARGRQIGNDSAEVAAGLWTAVERRVFSGASGKETVDSLARELEKGRGGRRVAELGFAADIRDASWLNRPGFQLVAEVVWNPMRIVATSFPS